MFKKTMCFNPVPAQQEKNADIKCSIFWSIFSQCYKVQTVAWISGITTGDNPYKAKVWAVKIASKMPNLKLKTPFQKILKQS